MKEEDERRKWQLRYVSGVTQDLIFRRDRETVFSSEPLREN